MQAPSSICTGLTEGGGDGGDPETRSADQDVQQNSATTAATTTTTTKATTTKAPTTKATTTKATTTKATTTKATTTKATTTKGTTTTTTKKTRKRTTQAKPEMVSQSPQPMPRSGEGSDASLAKHSNILIFVTFLAVHIGYSKA